MACRRLGRFILSAKQGNCEAREDKEVRAVLEYSEAEIQGERKETDWG